MNKKFREIKLLSWNVGILLFQPNTILQFPTPWGIDITGKIPLPSGLRTSLDKPNAEKIFNALQNRIFSAKAFSGYNVLKNNPVIESSVGLNYHYSKYYTVLNHSDQSFGIKLSNQKNESLDKVSILVN